MSCNYFFYDIGRRLTITNITKYMEGFGLGEPTGIELGEAVGILAGEEYRADWANRDSYNEAAYEFFKNHLSMAEVKKQLVGILARLGL